jgi:hypothetical protein
MSMTLPQTAHVAPSRAEWEQQTLRLYRRYEEEIVAACELCPWSSRVRREERVGERVLLEDDALDLAPSLAAIEELVNAGVEVGLLIYPRVSVRRNLFEQFAAALNKAEVARRPLGKAPFVFAVFHPEAAPDLAEPERLIPFLRRTPDPTIQLLRSSVLDKVRAAAPQGTQFVDPAALRTLQASEPSLRERIATANLATTLRIGVETLGRRLDDILRDRIETHRTLLRGGA